MSFIDEIHGGFVHPRRVRALTSELGALLPDAGRILDVGCGDGLLASLIQKNKPRLSISGIDILVRPGTFVPVEKFDGETIPYPEASFDSVVFVDVLHHTDDPMVLLREAVRVTRHNIVIKDHTMDGFAAAPTLRFMDRVGNLRHNVVLPHNYWQEAKWRSAFESLGLEIEKWEKNLQLYPAPANWLFGRSLHFVASLKVVK